MANIEIGEAQIGDTSALTEMAQYTTTALENLAIANTTYRNTFNELTKKKAYQSYQITTPTNKLLVANKVVSKLKTEIAKIKHSNGYDDQ